MIIMSIDRISEINRGIEPKWWKKQTQPTGLEPANNRAISVTDGIAFLEDKAGCSILDPLPGRQSVSARLRQACEPI